ncbi:helix-turn-helix transcriptional regulator [Streptomyces sp. OspMP-M43]|uniref:helix-turn-helix domain-containing protein n=1 Tax=Streptomyces sp. OspMP-M43 TaxID=1839781 RepID=UPI00081BBC09|nr:helix-turn-helix transcriptional regulator [Streptomyces sp. OspMP-M43]SCE19807.1 Helix-turn-helix domain-containing protein [Streptomyces sp. OspMP-M43]
MAAEQPKTELARNVRNHRRIRGWSQERLAEESAVSIQTVRKIEQGGDVRTDTLHQVAQGLRVKTAELFVPDSPTPVVGDEASRRSLVDLRKALMPPVGLEAPAVLAAEPGDVSSLYQRIEDVHALYWADRYDSVARQLPALLKSTEAAAAVADGEQDRHDAVRARTFSLLLAGKYLTQVRQYDLAYHALAESIRLARENGQTLTAGTGIVGMCWLLLRQDRFDESEALALQTAESLEPRMSSAKPSELAVWGELWLRVASATVRNNRPDDAVEARRMAGTAASALGQERNSFPNHWGGFGPVTAEMKVVEDLALDGDARAVLRRADEGVLGGKALKALGKPTAPNWGRHRLDVAQAHVKLGSHQDAMSELAGLRESNGAWLKHQPLARYVMSDVLSSRKRTLTTEMRNMASYLGVF